MMNVKDIMTEDFVKIGPDDTIQSFISSMERYHIHSAPVVDTKNKLIGNLEYKRLTNKGINDPSTAKVRAFMDSPPPSLKPEGSVEDAADKIFKTGLRSLPVVDGGKVVGVVSVLDVIDAAAGTKMFRQTAAETIMSAAEVVSINDDIGKARVLMREKGISRLPVVDSNGKLVGVVTVFDMLRAIKPRERQGWFSMATEVEHIMGFSISNVMNKNPVITGPRTSLSELAGLMVRNKTSGIIITDAQKPIGVVTTKDLLEVYTASLSQKGVYYQVIGLQDEDEMVVATVDRMIRDTLQKVAAVVPLQFFFVHVKKHSGEGLRIKYSIRARLRTDDGVFMSKAVKWDARDAIGSALDNLERIMLKKKEETVTRVQKGARKLKQLQRTQEM